MPTASLAATRTAKPEPAPASPDLEVIKTRQRVAWSSGNYAVVGTTLQIVGEELCEALDLRAGRKVLDVAAGNGMASLAAARRWCDVVSTDYVSSLLERWPRAGIGRRPADRVQGGRRRGAALWRQFIRYRDLDLRRDVHAQPGPGCRRIVARLQAGRPDRTHKLDARRVHRASLQDARKIFAAAGRRKIASALGNARTSHRNVRTGSDLDQDRAAPLQLPLSLGGALRRCFPATTTARCSRPSRLSMCRSRPDLRKTCTTSSRA